MFRFALPAALTVATLAACAPAPAPVPTSQQNLIGAWNLLSIGGSPVSRNSSPRIAFTPTAVQGNFGCSDFTGTYIVTGDVIQVTLTDVQSNCTGPIRHQDKRGLDRIQQPMTLIADPTQAILSGPSGQSFMMVR